MKGLSKLLFTMATAPSLPRQVLGRDDVDGFGISTVNTPDQGLETAIGTSDDNWHPVERYGTDVVAAQAGHAKWVQFIKDGNREVVELGYDDLVDPRQIVLK